LKFIDRSTKATNKTSGSKEQEKHQSQKKTEAKTIGKQNKS
jgi:hypothetical protein